MSAKFSIQVMSWRYKVSLIFKGVRNPAAPTAC